MGSQRGVTKSPVAEEVPIDDSDLPFVASTVQEAIEKQAVSVGLPLTILLGQTFTIPENRQAVVAELFIDDGGHLIMEGDSLLSVIS
jgi:hypothetical protein